MTKDALSFSCGLCRAMVEFALLDKLDNEAVHNQLLQAKDFTEQEKSILSLWKTEPNISTRKLSACLNISQPTVSRAVRKLKEKLAG